MIVYYVMGLMFIFTALLSAFIGLGGYAFPKIRNVEDIMPDYDSVLDEADQPTS